MHNATKAELNLRAAEILQSEGRESGQRALLMMSVLFSTVRGMSSIRSEAERAIFERILLNLAFEVIPAEDGRVLIEGIPEGTRYSNILERVVADQVATHVIEKDRSIIAAPLLVTDLMEAGLAEGAVRGVIYLASQPGESYNESQLELLASIAIMAANYC